MARFFKSSHRSHGSHRYFILLFSLFTIHFSLLSCQEGGEAGDLFGQWRLKGSDNKYVSFSGSVCLFRHINKGEVFGKFQHVGDSLFIECVSILKEKEDTALVESTFGFKPFTNIRLKINTLNSDDLELSQGGQTWQFYKY
jgi:hypothetical protein